MASRLLTRTLRSLAPISSFLNKHPTHSHLPISASSSSSLIFHKRTSSSPTFLTSTPIRFFTSQPDHNEHKPKTVTLTSIIHELADAGQTNQSLDIYKRFKAAGIFPPYTTFITLIKALAADPEFVEEAKECVVDMMTNHLCNHPSVSAFMAVYKGFVKQDKAKEGRRFLKEIKAKGSGRVDEEDVREALRGRPEAEVKRVIQILMDDKYGESTRPLESLYNNFAAVDAHFMKYTHQELSSNEYFLQNMKIASVFMMGCEAESMFVGLIQDGLTEEAMKIRSSILETGKIPAVVFFTFGIGSTRYVVGRTQEAIDAFHSMLSRGVAPNAYTYSVLIKTLAKDADFIGDAKKYLLEMVDNGMRSNAETCKSVLEAFARAQKMEECRELLNVMKGKGFVID